MDAPEGFEALPLGEGFSDVLGDIFVDRAAGTMRMWPGAALGNPVGTLHGGAIATFADAQVAAVHAGAEAGQPHTATISLSIDYVAPAMTGTWLEMRVTLVKITRTMIFTQALIYSGDILVARSTAIYNNKARTMKDD